MGLQFENLVLNNKKHIHASLGLSENDIINSGPYFQKKTKAQNGCQVDYLIQTKYNSLHVCEIRFSKNKIGPAVINHTSKKIQALSSSKVYSIWPVLIHVNGVTDAVIGKGFFSKIIDFGSFLQ